MCEGCYACPPYNIKAVCLHPYLHTSKKWPNDILGHDIHRMQTLKSNISKDINYLEHSNPRYTNMAFVDNHFKTK